MTPAQQFDAAMTRVTAARLAWRFQLQKERECKMLTDMQIARIREIAGALAVAYNVVRDGGTRSTRIANSAGAPTLEQMLDMERQRTAQFLNEIEDQQQRGMR